MKKNKNIILSVNISANKGRLNLFKRAINSIYHQQIDPNLIELNFLNDGGEKEIYSLLKYYSDKFRIRYFYVYKNSNETKNPAARWNFLARRSCGKYLLSTDPEVIHLPSNLTRILNAFNTYGEKIWYCGPVYGTYSFIHEHISINQIRPYEKKIIGKTPKKEKQLNFEYFRKCKKYLPLKKNEFEPQFFATAISRNIFEKIKGFNENFLVWGYENIEFYERYKKMGGVRIFDKKFVTYHLPHKLTIPATDRSAWCIYNKYVTKHNDSTWGNLYKEKVIEYPI